MVSWAVTANLGGNWLSSERKAAMVAWTRDVIAQRRPIIFFAQETFPAWLALFDNADDYTVVQGVERGWAVRSALVCRSDHAIEPIGQDDLPNLWYHGTYVAAARWSAPNGATAILASVHASPNPARPDRDGWPSEVELPTPRDPGLDTRWPRGLWDSDLLLLTIRDLRDKLGLPVIACGDLNEALGDDPEGGLWGKGYFARAREFGLSPWLHDRWTIERSTRGSLQLDHVLASQDALPMLLATPEPEVDPHWVVPSNAAGLSDHAPVWFAMADTLG